MNKRIVALTERLKEEALANAERDVALAAEWFPMEEETCQIAQVSRREK
jgi:hypothetical protein